MSEDNKKLMVTEKRKPPAAGKGRPVGATNKLTRSIKEAIEAAFHGVGGVEYLMRQAEENPTAFMTLLGKIIPAKVEADVTHKGPSVADMQAAVLAALANKHKTD